MVSIRCKMLVKEELQKLNLHFTNVNLGEVTILENITEPQRENLKKALYISGLELMDDKRAMLIEKIKNVVIEMIHYADDLPKNKFF
jgi:hypothetical protein